MNEKEQLEEVTQQLENATLRNTPLFVPPIKYCKVIKVYDGDTIHVAALIQGTPWRFKVRLREINTPELNKKDEKDAAIISRDRLKDKLFGTFVKLTEVSVDRYNRVLAKVFLNGQDISQWMLENNYAKPY